MNSNASWRLTVGALAALLVLSAIGALAAPAPPAPPLSVRSTAPEGAMALRLWLEKSGYTVDEVLSDPINPGTARALFILNPLKPYTPAEAIQIRDWVRRGNTLIVSGGPYGVSSLLDVFNASLESLDQRLDTGQPAGPVLVLPPVNSTRLDALYGVRTSRQDAVIFLVVHDSPVLVSLAEGSGRVWISGFAQPFTNRGLADPGSARLILNLLAYVPASAVIGFDEARHGFASAPSLSGWLFATAPGLGILLAVAITMVFLAMRGRRFGKAVPLPEERLRREPVEYIQAMANLFRRSGQRGEMLRHYRAQLVRGLSERYGVDPRLNSVELVKMVAFREPSIDEGALRDILRRLDGRQISEPDLVRVATDVDAWLRRLS